MQSTRSRSRSFISRANIHKKEKGDAPILYITGQTTYTKGVLLEPGCTEEELWHELTQKQPIYEVLIKWKERVLANQQNQKKYVSLNIINEEDFKYNDGKTLIDTILDFRMIIHKTKKMKISYAVNKNKKYCNSSNCQYFALLWVPSNAADGMTEKEYKALIGALRQSAYFVNKLDKECVYISGPQYGSPQDSDEQIDNHYKNEFDLNELEKSCKNILDDDTLKKLDIEIAVHQLDREKHQQPSDSVTADSTGEDVKQQIELQQLQVGLNGNNIDQEAVESKQTELDEKVELLTSSQRQDELDEDDEESGDLIQQISLKTENHIPKKSFAAYSSNEWHNQPMTPTNYNFDEIKSQQSRLSKESHVFAFVWFLQIKNETVSNKKEKNKGTLPALTVMNELHQQPYNDSRRMFNVELLGYDNCYKNLDLVVDRKGLWKDAILVFIQCVFLPIFVLIPPIHIIKCFNKKFKVSPRYRPCTPEFEELDRTEQIPWDITALWKFNRRHGILFRFISFILSLILMSAVYIGPFLYEYYPGNHHHQNYEAKHLSAFDCFGAAFFYSLATFTVMWWSCHSRVTIGPKEHMLLYYKLYVQRPKATQEHKPRSDWAALTSLSHTTVLTTMIYAHRKGFLELKTPTHSLLSPRRFGCIGLGKKCQALKSWIFYSISILIYFGTQNLENFELYHPPFYVAPSVEKYELKTAYAVVSSICSWIFVWCFILLWDTMFERMGRQHENTKSLTNLIVRNAYSEYIEFDYVDNILSWLSLEKFIKRKGMMLFASLETPLFSLFLLSFASWSGTIYCIFRGVGLKIENDASFFSNSTLATWFYLAILSLITVCRMLWMGHKFEKESIKQTLAIKSQCGEMHENYLLQQLKHDQLSKHEKHALKTSQMLLSHIEHSEIVPKVFGLKFDKLTAKAGWTAIVSAIPTVFAFVASKMNFHLD